MKKGTLNSALCEKSKYTHWGQKNGDLYIIFLYVNRVERIFWKPHTETSATHLGVLDGDLKYRGGGGGFSSHGNGMVHGTSSKCYKN